MKTRNRRRIIFVSRLQYQLIAVCMGLVICVSIILVGTLFLVFRSKIALSPLYEDYVNNILSDSLLPVIVIGIIVLFASLWAMILISHKIYGPLYRFGRYVKRLSEGEKTDALEFRKGDAIDGLKDIYNDLRLVLEKTLHYDYNEMVGIFTQLQDILDKIHHDQIKDEELTKSLQNLCDRIAQALDITAEVVE